MAYFQAAHEIIVSDVDDQLLQSNNLQPSSRIENKWRAETKREFGFSSTEHESIKISVISFGYDSIQCHQTN